jgi:spermidine synthase
MKPWRTIASLDTADGLLELRLRGEADFLIVSAGRVLMTSSARLSEEALATRACGAIAGRSSPRVLVSGLGMGYTLRAALDALPGRARVTVVELHRAIVAWCRGPLASATRGALDDARVTVKIADVARVIAGAPRASFDAIILDLYEGPYATQGPNDPFFGPKALAATHAALAPQGVLAIWSEEHDPRFAERLAAARFTVTTYREGRGGRRHVIYLGHKSDEALRSDGQR